MRVALRPHRPGGPRLVRHGQASESEAPHPGGPRQAAPTNHRSSTATHGRWAGPPRRPAPPQPPRVTPGRNPSNPCRDPHWLQRDSSGAGGGQGPAGSGTRPGEASAEGVLEPLFPVSVRWSWCSNIHPVSPLGTCARRFPVPSCRLLNCTVCCGIKKAARDEVKRVAANDELNFWKDCPLQLPDISTTETHSSRMTPSATLRTLLLENVLKCSVLSSCF
ncbi:uncharacterized protein LOC110346482 [Heterocephalus glaber]|uniref:Uncharacterized protein LOC110346482 n=1 Tax=Heterocephalus glaber TaxID=10181 RepID=A0AAX6S2V8_HETGA|nr:uncharacterized protein LOC110346482 [Heterocephalus glaber]